MAASILVSMAVGLLVLTTIRMRRRLGHKDSISNFAAARKAMSSTAVRSAVRTHTVIPEGPAGPVDPSTVVVRNGVATLLDPMARHRIDEVRRRFRTDPETLARRPTVAMLPRLLTDSPETDANVSVVPLFPPESEAS